MSNITLTEGNELNVHVPHLLKQGQLHSFKAYDRVC